ncbi:hypothetical protein [Dehalococcoides mccartyi]|uniref:hypothetical protein n=1 Tax=Dehalococcoides mccartyi TaxID=61435 RepID=UPI0007505A02|nr:hypothetical protein [Dehalococcoides mccartyi]
MKQLLIVGAIFLVALFSIGLASGGLTGDNNESNTNLQSNITQPSVDPQLGTLLATFTSSGSLTSAPFTVPASGWKIRWSYVPSDSYCYFVYQVMQQGITLPLDLKSYDSTSVTNGINYVYFGPGTYYIVGDAANISSWTLQIYA